MPKTVDLKAYTEQRLLHGELVNQLKWNSEMVEQLQSIVSVLVAENKLLIDRVENGK